MSLIDKAVAALKEKVGDRVVSVEVFRDRTTVQVDRAAILECCRVLRDHPELEFNRLSSIIGVDYWPKEPRFSVVYQLYSIRGKAYLGLKVALDGSAAELQTIESLFPNANWYEREVYDMFGVKFIGHSDMRRILMPYDWEGHPQRKDYPLGYEEVQFTFNFDEIDRQKKYAKE